MLFSLTNPEVAILMMGLFLFAVLLGFPIAFTLMAMGIGFGYYAYYDPTMMEHYLIIGYFNCLFKTHTQLWIIMSSQQCPYFYLWVTLLKEQG